MRRRVTNLHSLPGSSSQHNAGLLRKMAAHRGHSLQHASPWITHMHATT